MMTLCDIGNSSADFMDESGKHHKILLESLRPEEFVKEIHFISVNRSYTKDVFAPYGWIDVGEWADYGKYYPTMGIDRIMVCEAVEEGVIVDAGSAITVDVMEGGSYRGGFISLGLRAAREAYSKISPALDMSFNFEVELDTIPKNTSDAISYGYLAPLIHEIKRFGMPVYVTGGDADTIAALVGECVVDRTLVFKGMQKVIEKRLSKC